MDDLPIGLVARAGAERDTLCALLAARGLRVALTREPGQLGPADCASRAVAVWLVHVGEDEWTEAVDALLDDAVAPVFYDDPATLADHAYPSYWARQLAERLVEIASESGALALLEPDAPRGDAQPEEPGAQAASDQTPMAPTAPPSATILEFAERAPTQAPAVPVELDLELPTDLDLSLAEFAEDADLGLSGRDELLDASGDSATDALEIALSGSEIAFDLPEDLALDAEPAAVAAPGEERAAEFVLSESDAPLPLEDLDLALPDELTLDLDEAPILIESLDIEAGLSAEDWELDTVALDVDADVGDAQGADTRLHLVVLAASLGGPAAVKRFLQSLPSGLPAVFVLAQHIDPGFLPVLARALESASPYQVVMVEGSHSLEPGQLVLVPVASRLSFAGGGLVTASPAHWTPPYAPCINDVMQDVARVYGQDAFAIVFSGMGDDGAEGTRAMVASGGEVWAQDADSCANSSMPDSARATGLVAYTGTPEELAMHCAERLGGGSAHAVNH